MGAGVQADADGAGDGAAVADMGPDIPGTAGANHEAFYYDGAGALIQHDIVPTYAPDPGQPLFGEQHLYTRDLLGRVAQAHRVYQEPSTQTLGLKQTAEFTHYADSYKVRTRVTSATGWNPVVTSGAPVSAANFGAVQATAPDARASMPFYQGDQELAAR